MWRNRKKFSILIHPLISGKSDTFRVLFYFQSRTYTHARLMASHGIERVTEMMMMEEKYCTSPWHSSSQSKKKKEQFSSMLLLRSVREVIFNEALWSFVSPMIYDEFVLSSFDVPMLRLEAHAWIFNQNDLIGRVTLSDSNENCRNCDRQLDAALHPTKVDRIAPQLSSNHRGLSSMQAALNCAINTANERGLSRCLCSRVWITGSSYPRGSITSSLIINSLFFARH
jgi:hypothetical protein